MGIWSGPEQQRGSTKSQERCGEDLAKEQAPSKERNDMKESEVSLMAEWEHEGPKKNSRLTM